MDAQAQLQLRILKTFRTESFTVNVGEDSQEPCKYITVYYFDRSDGSERELTMCTCCAAELVDLLIDAVEFADRCTEV